jgi:hypothetical protein
MSDTEAGGRRCGGPCRRLLPAAAFSRVLMRGKRTPRSYCRDCERRYYRNAAALARLAAWRAARLELIKRRHAARLAARRAGRPRYTATEAGL